MPRMSESALRLSSPKDGDRDRADDAGRDGQGWQEPAHLGGVHGDHELSALVVRQSAQARAAFHPSILAGTGEGAG